MAHRVSGKRWSTEEIRLLREKRGEGVPYKEIARTLGRTVSACYTQALLQQYRPEKRAGHWSPEEDEKAVECLRAGKRIADIAKMLGRSYQSCSARSSTNWRRAIECRPVERAGHWSPEEDEKAVECLRAGKRMADIAKTLGRSINSCNNRSRGKRWRRINTTKCGSRVLTWDAVLSSKRGRLIRGA